MKNIYFLFFFFLLVNSLQSKNVSYPFTAKELVYECEAWIPGETAAQQEAKREYPCIRYIQSTINTYQFLRTKSDEKLPDLCITEVLNLQRHKDVFIKYVKDNPIKQELEASPVIIESLINSYCK